MAAPYNNWLSPQSIKSGGATATTANTTFSTSPTNVVTIFTAGAKGAILTSVTAIPVGNVSGDTNLQLYRDKDGAGTNKFLFNVKKYTGAWTANGTTQPSLIDFGYSGANPLRLAANEKVYAAIGVTTGGFNFLCEGGDYV